LEWPEAQRKESKTMTVRLPGARTGGGRNELLRKEETAEAPGNAPEPWGGMEKIKINL